MKHSYMTECLTIFGLSPHCKRLSDLFFLSSLKRFCCRHSINIITLLFLFFGSPRQHSHMLLRRLLQWLFCCIHTCGSPRICISELNDYIHIKKCRHLGIRIAHPDGVLKKQTSALQHMCERGSRLMSFQSVFNEILKSDQICATWLQSCLQCVVSYVCKCNASTGV